MNAEPRFLLYAHRGASRALPENSLDAFERALGDGANALELDVHATSDGHFVVFHDRDGSRLSGQRSMIRDTSLDQVRSWRLAGSSATVATLEELLGAFTEVRMSIDLKPSDPALVEPFLRLLQSHCCESWVTVASFHHRIISKIRKMGWEGRTALSRYEVSLLRFAPAPALRRRIGGECAQIPRSFGPIRLDREKMISRCRRLGLRADFWVVNDVDTARTLVKRGATGLMTDDPALLVPALDDLL